MQKGVCRTIGIGLLCAAAATGGWAQASTDGDKMTIRVWSTAFEEDGIIPRQFTCDGEDISPPLSWDGVPEQAQSLVLIADDPDAPTGTWVHWVIYDLPATMSNLSEHVPSQKVIRTIGRHGITDFGRVGYGGPCPPTGTHRYFFKLYALDTRLNLEAGKTKSEVELAMQGHILAQGQLMGRYRRT